MYIGIDGGGTKTKGILIDDDQQIITEAVAGPSSLRSNPPAVWLESLTTVIKSLTAQAKTPIKAIFTGLGDVSSGADQETIKTALHAALPQLKAMPLWVDNDVLNAHASSFLGEEGIILIAGTGSVVYGIDQHQQTHRVGGYSYTEGDEGSAFHLGWLTLKLLGRVFDQRASHSELTQRCFKHFKLETFEDMVALYERHHTDRSAVAALAPWVTEAAAHGDEHAQTIIEHATESVMEMIETVVNRLDFNKRRVAFIGSLAQLDTPYKQSLTKKINAFDPTFTWLDARNDPAFGAALIAQKRHLN